MVVVVWVLNLLLYGTTSTPTFCSRSEVGRRNANPCAWVSSYSRIGKHIFPSPTGPSSSKIGLQASALAHQHDVDFYSREDAQKRINALPRQTVPQ